MTSVMNKKILESTKFLNKLQGLFYKHLTPVGKPKLIIWKACRVQRARVRVRYGRASPNLTFSSEHRSGVIFVSRLRLTGVWIGLVLPRRGRGGGNQQWFQHANQFSRHDRSGTAGKIVLADIYLLYRLINWLRVK